MRLNLLELAKIALALLSIFALSGQVMAGVYKCLDRQNRTYYQDSPCQEMMAAKLPNGLGKTSDADESRAFFWKAAKGKATLYLLGSLHFGTQSLLPLPQLVNDAFNRSDVLVVEADINNLSSKEIADGLSGKGRYTDNSKLEEHIKRITMDKTLDMANKLELSDESLTTAKPWFAALMLNAQALKREGYNPALGIDKSLIQQAQDKKTVMELESVEDQINLFDQFSDQEQEQMLLHTLHELGRSAEYHKSIVDAWKQGDAEAMDLLVRQSFDSGQLGSKLFQLFYLDRNERMTNRLVDLLNDGRSYFVVVGSGHLCGAKGILKLLEQKGYTVTQP